MWRRRTALALLALAAICVLRTPTANAKLLDISVTIEPARATVGDHLTLTIVVMHPSDSEVSGPEGPEDFAPLELLEAKPPTTRSANDGLAETRFVYVVTVFRTGEVQPPELLFRAEGDSAEFVRPPAVTIESVLPADGVAELRDVRGPVQAAGPPRWPWAALIMAGFAGLTVITMLLVRPAMLRPAPQPVVARVEPSDVTARRELEAIGKAGLLERGELAEYYARIAACLRQYLSQRFEMPAVAMTPSELEARLDAQPLDRWPVRLAVNLLQQCEAAQFAQYEPARERAEADLGSAFEIVELTSPRETLVTHS